MTNTELRIGNYVFHEGIPLKVTSLYHDGRIGVNGVIRAAEELSPIPLTTEILEKAGFERADFNFHYDLYDLSDLRVGIHHKQENKTWILFHEREICWATNHLYLHTLMNIHHSLFGTELNIEL